MNITLANNGPSMWFLGEPGNIIATLNFANPGPISVDFENLSHLHKINLIKSIKLNQIVSDVSVEQLEALIEINPTKKTQDLQSMLALQQADEMLQKMKSLKEEATQRKLNEEQIREERMNYLIKQSSRAILTTINSQDDLFFLKGVLQKEMKDKQRKTVLKGLQHRINTLAIQRETAIAKEIKEEMTKQLRTKLYYVVDSEEEIVILTPEELVMAAEANK